MPSTRLIELPDPFRSVLISMYDGELQSGSDGARHPLDSRTMISPAEGLWVYDLCRRLKPANTLEIGLAYGFSTLYFLAALRENGQGKHTAVDPFQSYWKGIGMSQASRVGMSDHFSLVEERSFPALIHFADQRKKFDVILIDGNHRFDDVLVDFTLSAELCPIGGYVVCDDMWMPSIERAVAFLRANRTDFEHVSCPVQNAAVFRRTASDSRKWDHFTEFCGGDRVAAALRRYTPAFFRRIAARMLR
jgi:predicted O-methyltransferase YrrM